MRPQAIEDTRLANRARDAMLDRLEIRELLENWVLWRDSGDWDRFATLWHEDGRMNATWFQASAREFAARSKAAFDNGTVALHTLGGTSIDVNGSRAVAQTKMQITQRATFDGVVVDVTCQGRFVDALEHRVGRWGLVLRQPVYELDRITPVDPTAILSLDPVLLASYPEGYRHLAYIQTHMGFEVSKTLPGTRGPEITALNQRMADWLSGEPAAGLDSQTEPVLNGT